MRNVLEAYDASVTYIDAQVGNMFRAVDRLGLRDNTIFVFTRYLFFTSLRARTSTPGTGWPPSIRKVAGATELTVSPALANVCVRYFSVWL